MYIAYFNEKKPRVPLIPWVSFDTARFTVRVQVTVCAGLGTVWENSTHGIPMLNATDGHTLKAIGMGDVHIELPNGLKQTKAILKNVVYTPDMAFTLISISRLDEANCAVMSNKGKCTVKNPSGHTMATIPQSDGLYHIITEKSTQTDQANIASTKMSISEAHCKFEHISHTAIQYAVTQNLITGIDLDLDLKPIL